MKLQSLLSCILALAVASGIALAATPKVTDINEALSKAQSENKLLFLQYGREACGNCQALKGMIKAGKVQLSPAKYVYADVNCDDPSTSRVFDSKFKVSGQTLPFVVVAAPDGTQLAARSGYGSEADFNKLLKEAEKARRK
jgi:thioredoxin-related protein